MTEHNALRKAVLVVALANLGYFFIEFFAALHGRSVSLFADSIDFLEDASINILIFFAVAWGLKTRAKVGMVLSGIILIPGLATLWLVWRQVTGQQPPLPLSMSVVGFGALVVNFSCALLLSRFRHHKGSLTRAAFLSARNDARANVAIILAGLVTMLYPSIWPDIVVGLAIAAMNANAARDVYRAARQEHIQAKV